MRHTRQSGLAGILLLIILAIVTLSYFNVDIEEVAKKPETQAGITLVSQHATSLYESHLKQPLQEFWQTIVVDVVWKNFVESMKENGTQIINDGLQKIQQGETTS